MYVTRLLDASNDTLAEPPAANCSPVELVAVNCVALLEFSIGNDVVEEVINPLSLLNQDKLMLGLDIFF